MTSCRSVYRQGIICLILATVGLNHADVQKKNRNKNTSANDQAAVVLKKVDWGLLAGKCRNIEAIELRIDRKAFQRMTGGWGGGINRLEVKSPPGTARKTTARTTNVLIATKDPVMLSKLKSLLNREGAVEFALRYAIPDDGTIGSGWGGGGFAFGVLTIDCGRGTRFIIGISHVGFALNAKNANSDNLFFSASLAAFIDELYFSKESVHLSQDFFNRLSGKDHIENDLIGYKLMSRALDRKKRQ